MRLEEDLNVKKRCRAVHNVQYQPTPNTNTKYELVRYLTDKHIQVHVRAQMGRLSNAMF